ncbi:MAG: diguanylate cyclase [Nitrospirae bacterium]|nr:diguanylate cyclase [Nitrospirota bacterium]
MLIPVGAVYQLSLSDGTFEHMGEGVGEIFGLDAGRANGKRHSIKDVLHPFYEEPFERFWRSVHDGQPYPTWEFKIVDPMGNEKWIVQSNTPILDEKGKIVALRCECWDISGLLLSRTPMLEQELRIGTMVDNMNSGFVILDENMVIVYGNKKLAAMLSVEKEDMPGKHLLDFVDDEIRDYLMEQFSRLKTGTNTPYEAHYRLKDGRQVYIYTSSTPIFDEIGTFKGSFSVISDITEVKTSEIVHATLSEIIELSLQPITLKEQLQSVLQSILSIPWFEKEQKGCIHLASEDTGMLTMEAHLGLSEETLNKCHKIPLGRCLCGHAALARELLFFDAVEGREGTEEGKDESLVSYGNYCVPICSGNRLLGIINLYLRKGHTKNTQEIKLLTSVAHTLTIMIEKKIIEESFFASEEKYRRLIDTAGDAILITDAETGLILEANKKAEELTGIPKNELIGLHQSTLYPVELAHEYSNIFTSNVAAGQSITENFLIRHVNGKTTDADIRSSVTELGDKRILISIFRDITRRKHAETIIQKAKDDLEVRVLERTEELIATNDYLTKEIKKRKKAEEIIERNYLMQDTISSVLRMSLEPISLKEQLERTLELILFLPWLSLQSKGSIFLTGGLSGPEECSQNELVMVAVRGLNSYILRHCAKIPFGKCLCGLAAYTGNVVFATHIDDDHDVRYEGISDHGHYCVPIKSGSNVLGVINMYVKKGHKRSKIEEEFLTSIANTLAGIVERRKSERRLEKMALYDNLTGLPNRTTFFDRLQQAVRLSRRNGHMVALLFLDLDKFKVINDTLGHDIGDMLLKSSARRLEGCIRSTDSVARMGGDEFTVILSRITKAQDASIVAEKIIKTLSEPFYFGGHECLIGASVGISLFPVDAEEPELLLKRADSAMYVAKEHGRNGYRFFFKETMNFNSVGKGVSAFFERYKGSWDHSAWVGLLFDLNKKGFAMTNDMKQALGMLLESLKRLRIQFVYEDDKSVKSITNKPAIDEIMEAIIRESFMFVKTTVGKWNQSQWESFLDRLDQNEVPLHEETTILLGQSLEALKGLHELFDLNSAGFREKLEGIL